MSLVTIKNKYQIVIPAKVRRGVPLRVGDLLEASITDGKITLVPKTLLDRELAVSFTDFRHGRTSGSFNTAEALISYLKKEVKKIRASRAKRAPR
ncbi:MAG: AbrB family transcriptional regulator [Parcubacteria group bacterium Greene0416_79]|nr:MAG: AbrB family transcriptional regulator [Parcubacteria group bacterium Greene0416_79]